MRKERIRFLFVLGFVLFLLLLFWVVFLFVCFFTLYFFTSFSERGVFRKQKTGIASTSSIGAAAAKACLLRH